jgi:hypothetical protein
MELIYSLPEVVESLPEVVESLPEVLEGNIVVGLRVPQPA